jgi:phosphate transport system substrate-binding protein
MRIAPRVTSGLNNMRLTICLAIMTTSAVLLLSGVANSAGAAELRVSGAATVAKGIIIPNQTAIEQETGLTLTVTANGDGNGLKDLYAGRSDVFMVAAPMKVTEQTLNKASPDSVSIGNFQLAPVGKTIIRFVLNPANPVKSLTAAQIRDIFTGKITSWKDVGGDDLAIVVVAEAPGLGTRTNVESSFLAGEPITASARTMQALVQVIQVTAQLPAAISYGNSSSITSNVTVIPGIEVEQSLGLATKGAPSADMLKLVAAVAKYGATMK